jgi:hypothetical protein
MHHFLLNTPSGTSEILVGESLSMRLDTLDPAPVLLVDEHVLCEHQELFQAYRCISVPSGEAYKNLQTIEMPA